LITENNKNTEKTRSTSVYESNSQKAINSVITNKMIQNKRKAAGMKNIKNNHSHNISLDEKIMPVTVIYKK